MGGAEPGGVKIMALITADQEFRVRLADNKNDLRGQPLAKLNVYTSGSEKTALKSAIEDLNAMRDGAAFIVEKWHVPAGMQWADGYYQTYRCGEKIDGRYYPRNNL